MKVQRHLVVVDDDRDIQGLIIAFFKPKGYKVTTYSDAETALKALAVSGDTWDVILSDLNLPKLSGVELTTEVKKLFPNLPVVLITTTKSAEIALTAVEKGAYDFIVKPIHFAQLQISVERALRIREMGETLNALRERVRSGPNAGRIIGKSPLFLRALDVAQRVAKSKANIFVTGESGTGKEIFAKYIHAENLRKKGPFVAINCSAIPETLLESELFGHAKGAFTGAQQKKIGLFEEAQDGTLFLDEIGDLTVPLQAKLLRVLQERKIKRVGENIFRPINCRIISATHKDLINEIQEGRFREDLFFRLNVIPIAIPPLRDRPEDLLPLAEFFLRRFALENDSPVKTFSKEAIRFILENKWRGNVRELENSVERAVVLTNSPEIPLENLIYLTPTLSADSGAYATADLRSKINQSDRDFVVQCGATLPDMNEVINQYIEFAVNLNGGARDRTAKEIGIDRKTLYKRLRQNEELVQ